MNTMDDRDIMLVTGIYVIVILLIASVMFMGGAEINKVQGAPEQWWRYLA